MRALTSLKTALALVSAAITAWVAIDYAIDQLPRGSWQSPEFDSRSPVFFVIEAELLFTALLTVAGALRLRGRPQCIAFGTLAVWQVIAGALAAAALAPRSAPLFWAGCVLLSAGATAALGDSRPWLSWLLGLASGIAAFLVLSMLSSVLVWDLGLLRG